MVWSSATIKAFEHFIMTEDKLESLYFVGKYRYDN